MVKTHFSQYPGASFITFFFFYTNAASRLLVWFKEKRRNSERWGNRVESHVTKAWTM